MNEMRRDRKKEAFFFPFFLSGDEVCVLIVEISGKEKEKDRRKRRNLENAKKKKKGKKNIGC